MRIQTFLMKKGIFGISWIPLLILIGVICTLIYTWRLDLLHHHFNELFLSVFTLSSLLYYLLQTKKQNKTLQNVKKELSNSNELMKYVIEHNSSGIAVHDKNLNYIYVSQKYIDDYGIKEKDIIGKHHYEIFPNLPQKWRDAHQKALAGEVTMADEDPYISDHNSLEYTRWICLPWYKVDKSLGGIIVYTSVITDLVISQQKLRERDRRYHSLYEDNNINILIFDKKTFKIVDANSAACKFYGWTKEELTKKKVSDVAATSHEKVLAEVEKMHKEKGSHFHIKQKLATGEIRDVEIYEGELFLQSQDLIYIMVLDVTERKKTEKALRESQEKNEALLKAHPDMMFLIDKEGRLREIYVEKSSSIFISQDDVGRNFHEVVPFEIAESFQKRLDQLFETNEMQRFQFPFSVNGKMKFFSGRIVKAGVKNALLVVTDVTSRIEIEQELIRAKEKAEESDRLKSAFLSNMSHEIRTPMNGILGFTDLLKDPEISQSEREEYIQIIDQSGHRLLNIINDIVEISKIEAGIIQKKISEININEHLDYIGRFFRLEVEKKKMLLKINNLVGHEEAIVNTDSEKLYAVLINLVKNAIKYSEVGTIEVGCIKNQSHFEFYVKDTGFGISEDKQKEIFERFIQANYDKKRIIEGTGLGLSIAKAYVEMLGGEIWLKSKVNVGSTFYFTIPIENNLINNLTEKKDTINQAFNLNKPTKINVLIADDDELSLKLLTKYLDLYCSKIYCARNGKEALEIFKKNPDIKLIFMDVKMPEMDGYETTKEIRKFNREIVIVAQTAYALSEDKEMAINAGCTDYLSKPVNREMLEKLICKYFDILNPSVINKQQANP